MYNVLGCTHVRHQEKAHGSNRYHNQFVKNRTKDLLTKGICYYYNEEQKEDIIKLSGISVTFKTIDEVDYIIALN